MIVFVIMMVMAAMLVMNVIVPRVMGMIMGRRAALGRRWLGHLA